jgi:hypothetical protein
MCTYGEAFRPLVDAAASSGWSFINEGRPGAPKWGYIARKPGAALRIVVDSRAGAPPAGQGGAGAPSGGSRQQHDAAASRPQQHAQQRMSVMIAYLKSYEGMGMASFECARALHVSIMHAQFLPAAWTVYTAMSSGPSCGPPPCLSCLHPPSPIPHLHTIFTPSSHHLHTIFTPSSHHLHTTRLPASVP